MGKIKEHAIKSIGVLGISLIGMGVISPVVDAKVNSVEINSKAKPCMSHVILGEHTKEKPLRISCEDGKKSYLYGYNDKVYFYNNKSKSVEELGYSDNIYVTKDGERVSVHVSTGYKKGYLKGIKDKEIRKAIQNGDDRKEYLKLVEEAKENTKKTREVGYQGLSEAEKEQQSEANKEFKEYVKVKKEAVKHKYYSIDELKELKKEKRLTFINHINNTYGVIIKPKDSKSGDEYEQEITSEDAQELGYIEKVKEKKIDSSKYDTSTNLTEVAPQENVDKSNYIKILAIIVSGALVVVGGLYGLLTIRDKKRLSENKLEDDD